MSGRTRLPPARPRPLAMAGAATAFLIGVVFVFEAVSDGFAAGYAGAVLIAAAGLFMLRETRPRRTRR